MKKLGKIFVLSLVVTLICAVAVISASAVDANVTIGTKYDGTTKVGNTAFHNSTDGNTYYEYFKGYGNTADFSTGMNDMSKNFSYIVFEFDFMSEDGYKTTIPGAALAMNVRNSGGSGLQSPGITVRGSADGSKASIETTNGNRIFSFSPDAYVWHHVTIIYKVESTITESTMIVYFDGEYALTRANCFVAGSYRCDSFRIDNTDGNGTPEAKPGRICVDNFQYLTMNKKYTGNVANLFVAPEDHNLQEETFGDLIYNINYNLPYGKDVCVVHTLDGGTKKYDSFKKAAANYNNGETIELLGDVKNVVIDRPMTVIPGDFEFTYTYGAYVPREVETVNRVTGVVSKYVKFVKLSKFANYYWIIDHAGTVSAQVDKISAGSLPQYTGDDLETLYFDLERNLCYRFDSWKVFNKYDLKVVTEAEANSTYYVYPTYKISTLYGILTLSDGTVEAADSAATLASMLSDLPEGSSFKFVRDVAMSTSIGTSTNATVDLNGKTLTFTADQYFNAFSASGSYFKVTSSVEGAAIVMSTDGIGSPVLIATSSEEMVFDGANIAVSNARIANVNGGKLVFTGKVNAAGVTGNIVDIYNSNSTVELNNVVLENVSGAAFLNLNMIDGSTVVVNKSVLTGASTDALIVANDFVTETSVTFVASEINGFKVATQLAPGLELNFPKTVTFDAESDVNVVSGSVLARVDAVGVRYAIVSAEDAVEIIWMNDQTSEWWAVGSKPVHKLVTDNYVEGDLFYRANAKYVYTVGDAEAAEATVVAAEWVGETVTADPLFTATDFRFVVYVDGVYTKVDDVNLDDIIEGKVVYGDDVTVILGRAVLLPAFAMNEAVAGDLTIDLNGHVIVAKGTHTIRRNVTFLSSVDGAEIRNDNAGGFYKAVGEAEVVVDASVFVVDPE